MICCDGLLATPAGACFDATRTYRYALWRTWGPEAPLVAIMLNPSIADETQLDRTVTRVQSLAKRLGCGGIAVGNAFAIVSTDPDGLYVDPFAAIGPENDSHLERLAQLSGRLIVAWGTHLEHRKLAFRLRTLRQLFGDRAEALHVTKNGSPGHPLYLPSSLEPAPYVWR